MSEIRKVVINACFGGFGLSEAAMLRYAEIKGFRLWPVRADRLSITTYWKVPPEQQPAPLPDDWRSTPKEVSDAYNAAYEAHTLYEGDIARDDPALVQAVEELGTAANGFCAELRVVEIPADVQWEIDEYDGNEHIAETHRSWR